MLFCPNLDTWKIDPLGKTEKNKIIILRVINPIYFYVYSCFPAKILGQSVAYYSYNK